MSVVMMGGVPCSGKSSIIKRVIHGLGSGENIEPMTLFPCQRHDDILVVGRYPEGQTFGGTDRLSYATISKFTDFILQEYPKHKHIIIEGDRFFRVKDIEWLVHGYDTKVYVLQVSSSELKKRHFYRKDKQSDKWLKGRNTQIQNILTNLVLMGELNIRTNDTQEDSQELVREIRDLITSTS